MAARRLTRRAHVLSSVDAMRKDAPLLVLFLAACGDDIRAGIATEWTFQHSTALAPPGLGPDNRVLVASRDTPGRFWTLDPGSGNLVEGPFDTIPVQPAPVALNSTIYLVTIGGQVVRLNLAGNQVGTAGPPLGRTSPLVPAPDTSIRLGTTTGRALSIDRETALIFDVDLGAPVTSAPAVSSDGTAYYATDTGRLVGLDPSGVIVFDVSIAGPASGPSIFEDRIAVGGATSVTAYNRNTGLLIFARPRAARVVGTRFLDDGTLLAWGEDGRLEHLSSGGEPLFSYEAGPPILVRALRTSDGLFGVVDSQGRAHLVADNGDALFTLELDRPPRTDALEITEGFALFTIENTIQALDFNFRR